MTSSARQLRAVALLSWRSFTRRSYRGGKPKLGVGSAAGRLALGTLMVGSFALAVSGAAFLVARSVPDRSGDTTLFLAWFGVLGVWWNVNAEVAPTLKKQRSGTLGDPGFGEVLPMLFPARLALLVARLVGILLIIPPALVFLAQERAGREWPGLAAIGLGFALVVGLFGAVVCIAIRALLPSRLAQGTLRVLSGLGGLAVWVGWLSVSPSVPSSFLAAKERLGAAISPPFRPLTELLTSDPPGSYWHASAWVLVVGALCVSCLWLAQRRGLDRALGVLSGRRKRSNARVTTVRVQQLLLWRQQGGKGVYVFYAAGFAASVVLSVVLLRPHYPPFVGQLAGNLPLIVGYLATAQVSAFALAQANWDRDARPFLSALPLAPTPMLAAKERALWWAVSPGVLLLLPPLVPMHMDANWALKNGPMLPLDVLQCLIAAVVVALVCRTMPALTFLTQGSGSPSSSGFFLRMLILLPVYGALLSLPPIDPFPRLSPLLLRVPSLLVLVIATIFIRRAALRRVQWLDDASPELDR